MAWRDIPSEPSKDGADVNTKVLTQLGKSSSYTIDGVKLGPSCISGLLAARGPTAIRWFIIAIIVGVTVQASTFWAISHVGQKCRERLLPPFAHRYSSTPIIGVADVVGIETSLFHVLPSKIGTTFLHRSAMFEKAHLFDAATGRGCSLFEAVSVNDAGATALAFAHVPSCDVSTWSNVRIGFGNNKKLSKGQSDKGYFLSHKSVVLICATLRDRQIAGALSL